MLFNTSKRSLAVIERRYAAGLQLIIVLTFKLPYAAAHDLHGARVDVISVMRGIISARDLDSNVFSSPELVRRCYLKRFPQIIVQREFSFLHDIISLQDIVPKHGANIIFEQVATQHIVTSSGPCAFIHRPLIGRHKRGITIQRSR